MYSFGFDNAELQAMDEKEGRVPWHVVNAALSVGEVQEDILE